MCVLQECSGELVILNTDIEALQVSICMCCSNAQIRANDTALKMRELTQICASSCVLQECPDKS